MAPQVDAVGSREREVHAAQRQLLHDNSQHRGVAHQEHLPALELQLEAGAPQRRRGVEP